MAAISTSERHELAGIYRAGGDYSQVYLDMSVDTSDPPGVRDERRKSVLDALARAGAPEPDIEAVTDVLATGANGPSPSCLFVLVKEGEILIEEVLPGFAGEQESVTFGPLPDLAPLLKMQPLEFCYLVVETSRDGGEVRLYRAGSALPESLDHVQGSTDDLHKVRGGDAWRTDHIQNHTEEVWRKNQGQLATTINDIVRQRSPRLIVVAGDIRARQLLADELSEAAKAILAIEPTNTRADGSTDDALPERINAEIERVLAADKEALLDRVNLHEGRGDNLVELSYGAIVVALASAQVDTLILDTDKLRDREALALAAEPWIASAPEEALGTPVVATVPAQLALTRAALLTDATVLFTDTFPGADDGGPDTDNRDVTLPRGASAAAILRWRTGPPVPGV
jgi:hypothetical protein